MSLTVFYLWTCCFFYYLEEPRFENRGMFKVEDDKNNTVSFDLYPNATISWINGKAPVDAPECGFENEKCPVEVKKKLCKLQLLCREIFHT